MKPTIFFSILLILLGPMLAQAEGRSWSAWFQQDVVQRYLGGLPQSQSKIELPNWLKPAPQIEISESELINETFQLINSNRQLNMIKSVAEKYGLELDLVGEAAAQIVHYAHRNLRLKKGDSRYMKSKLDGHFSNIFPWQENLTFTVQLNGKEESKAQFLTEIQSRLPFVKFENRENIQGNDNHSLAKINFQNAQIDRNQFLQDVIHQQLHLYNPRFSNVKDLIDTLANVSRHELILSYETESLLRRAISELPLDGIGKTLAARIYWHAANLEYTHGLLKNLDPSRRLATNDSGLAEFYNREVLSSKPLGRGLGARAQDIGIDYLTHQTENRQTYNAITYSPLGRPNVFISRQHNRNKAGDISGELARRGNGYYTIRGKDSEWHPDYGDYKVIQKLNPNAKVGADFFLYNYEVVLLNNSAIETADLNENLRPVEYFEFLADKKRYNMGDLFRQSWRMQVEIQSNPEQKQLVDEFVFRILSDAKEIYDIRPLFLRKYLELSVTNATGQKCIERLTHLYEKAFQKPDGRFNTFLFLWTQTQHAKNSKDIIIKRLRNPKLNHGTFVSDNVFAFRGSPLLGETWFAQEVNNSPYREKILEIFGQFIPRSALPLYTLQNKSCGGVFTSQK